MPHLRKPNTAASQSSCQHGGGPVRIWVVCSHRSWTPCSHWVITSNMRLKPGPNRAMHQDNDRKHSSKSRSPVKVQPSLSGTAGTQAVHKWMSANLSELKWCCKEKLSWICPHWCKELTKSHKNTENGFFKLLLLKLVLQALVQDSESYANSFSNACISALKYIWNLLARIVHTRNFLLCIQSLF